VFLSIESRFAPGLKGFISFQIIRHGVDFGYGAVPGSSLRDRFDSSYPNKYFLKDGVYKWDNILKVGGEMAFKLSAKPCSFFAEAGLVNTHFTINGHDDDGSTRIGYEADYESVNDSVYKPGNSFIFSLGFRLFF